MKTLSLLVSTIILTLISIGSITAKPTAVLNNLSELEWLHRIIIVRNLENSAINSQKIFDIQKIGINDRDIVWFILSANKNEVISNFNGRLDSALKRQLYSLTSQPNHRVILVGKDGGLKLKTQNLHLQNIFAQIDTMPMRILEMQAKQ